ncbi:hypothetical protein OG496_41470 [Streptomyces sp. NBC_00988]|uniref:hypothetical protein n=1 Tax=Streptomyces sp. NBC_00988 TaxID=2903704 RepID=UPI0038630CA6|nr:hypothetical protein OG496_41470 [Streptomyces sp. NBC_00988]
MEWFGDARLAVGPEAAWYLETAFTPGAQLGTVYDDPSTPVVVTGVERMTTIRTPSGRLIVDAPWHDDEVGDYEDGSPSASMDELVPAPYAAWAKKTMDSFTGQVLFTKESDVAETAQAK